MTHAENNHRKGPPEMTGKRTITVLAFAIAAVLALAGCGRNHSAASAASAEARVSAAATSTAVQAGKQDARALFAHCIPSTPAGQVALVTGSQARQAVMACAGVPKGKRVQAAECVLAGIEHGGKLPKGRQARELALLNAAYPCAQKYQQHAGSAK